MRIPRSAFLGVALLAGLTTSAVAQDRSWQNKWYWGTQGGIQTFALGGGKVAATAGGHWFITAGRSALYVAFDQQFMQNLTQTIQTGQTASFRRGQRFQATVYAVPSDNKLQVMLGGGFAISRITDAQLDTTVPTSVLDSRQLDDAATKAFLILSGALQYRAGLRWAIFGQYQYMPGSNDYVIRSAQHTFNLGLRYAVTHSEEVVTTER